MIKEINRTSQVQKTTNNNSVITKPEQTFNYTMSIPEDSCVTKKLWKDEIKGLILETTKNIGISSYKFSLLKNDNLAIAAAQNHLIDLMKYYEGDRNYYYEAITTPYPDKFGTITTGFGERSNKATTQEKAYTKLCANLEAYSNEVKNLLNKKIGKNTYENLPASIKEGLIDLNYNKGLPKISQNTALMNAIKNGDYSTVIKELAYVYSGKSNAQKVEDAGLYRRSLNRMILACRDLNGTELKEAKNEIEKCYQKALTCHKKNKISTVELEKIYEQFSKGKISGEADSSESYKINLDERYQGKGLISIAKSVYNSNANISFEEFYNEFLRINGNPKDIKLGQELKIPFTTDTLINTTDTIQNIQEVDSQKITLPEVNVNNETQKQENFWQKIGRAAKSFFKKIGDYFKNLFYNDKKQDSTSNINSVSFKELTKQAKITKDGDFHIITTEYEIQSGDNLWNLSRKYNTSEEILCNDNFIEDKNKINVGQKIKINKLGYKIQSGDTLTQIAKKFGLTVEILKDLNNIEDVDQIREGEFIEIPGFIYNVKSGDNLTKISKLVGVSIEDLKRLNNLSSDTIYPNQKIKIIYNNGFYGVSGDKRSIVTNSETQETIEQIDMSNTVGNRKYIQKANIVNGIVQATRHIFEPTGSGELNGKTIIVNAGHGYSQAGTDPGALGQKGLADEWLINYDNAMRLKDKLCAKGAKVIFLQGHANIIIEELKNQKNKADLFISVHVNSYDKKTQDRTQIYYTTKSENKKMNKKSAQIAECIEKNFDNWISKNESIKEKDKFYVNEKQDYAQSKKMSLGVCKSAEKHLNIPSVLWEVAFMISPKGRERMANSSLMNNYADVMTQSIVEYFS